MEGGGGVRPVATQPEPESILKNTTSVESKCAAKGARTASNAPAKRRRGVRGRMTRAWKAKSRTMQLFGTTPTPTPTPIPPAPIGTPVVIAGKLTHVGAAKPKRKRRAQGLQRWSYPIDMDVKVIKAMVRLPAVTAEVERQRRLIILALARVMVPDLLSQTQFCLAVGVTQSRFISWRDAFLKGGEHAVLPATSKGGRKPKNGMSKRTNAFLDVVVVPYS